MDDSNFTIKMDFINNLLDNATDEQIDELFDKAVELVNGKTKPMVISFQPVNNMPQFITPIPFSSSLHLNPNYNPKIICEFESEHDGDDDDYFNWCRR